MLVVLSVDAQMGSLVAKRRLPDGGWDQDYVLENSPDVAPLLVQIESVIDAFIAEHPDHMRQQRERNERAIRALIRGVSPDDRRAAVAASKHPEP